MDDHRVSTGSGGADDLLLRRVGLADVDVLGLTREQERDQRDHRQAGEERRHQPRLAAARVEQRDRDQRREAGDRRAQLARGGEARVAHARAEQLGVERGLHGDHRRPADDRGDDQRDPHEHRLAGLHEREERERPQAGEDHAEQVQRPPADPVRQRAEQRLRDDHEDAVGDHRAEHDALGHAELVGRVGDGERREHVGRGGVADVRADADQHAARVALERLDERQLDDGLAALDLLEHRRLLDPQAHPQRDGDQHEAEQERDAPAPRVELVVGQQRDEQERQRAEHEADLHAGLGERAEEAAPLLRRVLGEQRRRAAELGAGAEALEHAQRDEQDRRPHARCSRRSAAGRSRRSRGPSRAS